MSVINKMLRDLDRRNAPEMRGARHATGLLRGSVPSLSVDIPDPRRPSALRWVAWGGFVLATGSTLFWMDDILRHWVPDTPVPKPAMVMPPPVMPVEPAAPETQTAAPADQATVGGAESATGAAAPGTVATTAQGTVPPQGALPSTAAPASPGSVAAAPAAAPATAVPKPTPAASVAAAPIAPVSPAPQKVAPQASQAPQVAQSAQAAKPGTQPAVSVATAPTTTSVAPAAGAPVAAAPTSASAPAKAPVPVRPNAAPVPAAPQNPSATGPAAPTAAQASLDATQQRQQQAGRDALAQAQGLWNSGSRDAAIDVLQQAVAATERSGTASAPAHQLLVSLVRELTRMQLADGRSGAALELLTRLEPQLTAEPDLWAMRANAAQRLGRHQESLQAYRTALQARPNEQRWLLGAAVSLAALGQTANANELSEKARQQGPISRDVMTYLRQMGVQVRD